MYDYRNSKHFTKYTDPGSGVVSYILTTRAAAYQQGFYFVNSGFSDDGRYLWFYGANPPEPGHFLCLVDFEADTVSAIEGTYGLGFYVDPADGCAYWCHREKGLLMHEPRADAPVRVIAEIPEEIRALGVSYLATHLTRIPGSDAFLIDFQTSAGSIIGALSTKDGSFTKWYRTEPGTKYNHAQCHPTDPHRFLCAHEGGEDPVTHKFIPPPMVDGIYPRLQLITDAGERTMLKPVKNYATHEYWAPDGGSVLYCSASLIARDYMDGSEPEIVMQVPIEKGNGTWHSHCTKDCRYFVSDGHFRGFRGCPSTVKFSDPVSGRITDIISENPVVDGYSPENPCSYHIDPHPRFVLGDTAITHTTTVLGHVDVAITPVDQLIK